MDFIRKFFACLFVWNVKPTKIWKPDVILAHGAGDHEDGTPGPINEAMAARIRQLHLQYPEAPILAQGEIGQCLDDLPVLQIIVPRQRDRAGKYIDTEEVVRKQLALCKRHGWEHPVVFSFQPHILRAKMVTEKAFGTDVVVMIPRGLPKGYDRDCSQFWWRNRFIAIPREIAARMLYLFKGMM